MADNFGGISRKGAFIFLFIRIVIKFRILHNAASHPHPDKRHRDEAATHMFQIHEAW